MTRHAVSLPGCRPRPLAAYLKGLAVLRLVATQADPQATGHWQAEEFILTSRLDADALRRFLLEDWRPTPIAAPWNKSSGFWPGENADALEPFEQSEHPRFSAFAKTIAAIRDAIRNLDLQEAPDKNNGKTQFISLLRAALPDEAVDWVDAVVLVTSNGLKFPHLLGSGAIDGRLDFARNYQQRLINLIDPKTGTASDLAETRLEGALFGAPCASQGTGKSGQFGPGTAGGPNMTTGPIGDSSVNPWDFVLTIEGTIAFAAAATRRLEGNTRPSLSYPFTVLPSFAGTGAATLGDRGKMRSEIWLPLWGQPANWRELQALLSEGRATVGSRNARDGLDFARAIAGLGIARGISAFERVAFFVRAGDTALATPVGRVPVKRQVDADLIADLERKRWLRELHRVTDNKHAPARLLTLRRRLEDALYAMATRGGPEPVQAALAALGALTLYMAQAPGQRKELGGMPPLDGAWAVRGDDGSDAFHAACAVASLDGGVPLRCHIAPFAGRPHQWRWEFADQPSHLVTWGRGGLARALATTVHRRLITAAQSEGAPLLPFHGAQTTDLMAAMALLEAGDDPRLAELIAGLSLIRWGAPHLAARDHIFSACRDDHGDKHWAAATPPPLALALLAPLFTDGRSLKRAGLSTEAQDLPMPPGLPARLAAGDVAAAVTLAVRRLRASGLAPSFREAAAAGLDGAHLLSALLVPLDTRSLKHLAALAGITTPETDHAA